ncbi:MAG: hypothetical protein ABEL76_16300 [Bradymonadaceae bacterium]
MPQTRVKDTIEKAMPGQPFEDDPSVASRVNENGQAKQIETVTVDTASANTDYTITINGVDVTYTSGGSPSKQDIRDGLIEAVKDEPLVTGAVDPEKGQLSGVLTLTSHVPGQSFSFSESDPNLLSAQTQAAAEANPLEFGRAIIPDGLDLDVQAAKKATESALTARSVTLGFSDASGDTYTVEVTVPGATQSGDAIVARGEFTSSGGGSAALAQALRDDLNGALPPETVAASESGGDLVLDAELAGKDFSVSFDVEGGNGGGISVSSDNGSRLTDINDALVGVSCVKTLSDYPRDGAEGSAQIGPNDVFDVVTDGLIVVETEDQVDDTDDVYVRLSANNNLDQLGGFRASSDSGCVKLDAQWHGRLESDLAVLEL